MSICNEEPNLGEELLCKVTRLRVIQITAQKAHSLLQREGGSPILRTFIIN